MKHILEVCCADVESINAAKDGGADRIELCSSLETGGLTPSAGLIDYAVKVFPDAVNVLIRPRCGDFLYTLAEKEVILADIGFAVAHGAAGIVCGALNSSGDLDREFMTAMLEASGPASFTLHRAFDLCSNPEDILEEAVRLGVDRILTSGLSSDVIGGASTLKQLQHQAAGRIILLAGGGVNDKNVVNLIRLTGVQEVHASCKTLTPSRMEFRRNDVSMSMPGTDEFSRIATSAQSVKLLAEKVHSLNS